jgi:hypothetical protein
MNRTYHRPHRSEVVLREPTPAQVVKEFRLTSKVFKLALLIGLFMALGEVAWSILVPNDHVPVQTALLGMLILFISAVLAGEGARAIAEALAEDRLEDAQAIRDRLGRENPTLLKVSALIKAQSDLKAAESNEERRVLAFERAVESATSAPVSEQTPQALKESRKRARTGAERERVGEIERTRKETFRREVARNDQEVAPQLEEVGPFVATVESELRKAAPSSDVDRLIEEARTKLATIVQEFPLTSEQVRSLVGVQQKRLADARQMIAQREQRNRLEAAITRALSQRDVQSEEVESAIRAAIALDPTVPRSLDFERVLKERKFWGAYLEWLRIAAEWKADDRAPLPDIARQRAERCRTFLTQNPAVPGAREIADLAKYLEVIARRGDEDEGPRAQLKALFSDPLIDPVYTLKVNDRGVERLYYLSKRFDPKSLRISYLLGQGDKMSNVVIARETVLSNSDSPQMRIAREFKRLLDRDTVLVDWDASMIECSRKIAQDSELDPLFKIKLLRGLLRIAGEGSVSLARSVADVTRILEESPVDEQVAWMDPTDRPAAEERPKAQALLQTLPDWDAIVSRARGIETDIRRSVDYPMSPVGWLAKDERWSVRLIDGVPDSAELYVLVGDQNQSSWKGWGSSRQERFASMPLLTLVPLRVSLYLDDQWFRPVEESGWSGGHVVRSDLVHT